MIKQLTKIGLLLIVTLLSFQNIYSQDEKSLKMTLYSEFNNQKSETELTSLMYTIGIPPSPEGAMVYSDPDTLYLSLTTDKPVDKTYLKMFNNKKQSINGHILIVDLKGNLPNRKIEFKNATYILTESFSTMSYGDATSSALNIYTTDLIIDGVSIYKN